MGVAAPGGDHHLVDGEFPGCDLLQELLRRHHVSQGAQRRVPRAERDDVGAPSLPFQFLGDLRHTPVRPLLIFALGIGIQRRPQDPVQQHIP